MKNPPKYYKQTQTCCNKPLEWITCCWPGPEGCPDCSGAGGWWEECSQCGNQPYGDELLKSNNKVYGTK